MNAPANDRDAYRWALAADAVYDPADDHPTDLEPITQHTWANPSAPLSDDAAYFWGLDATGLRSLTDRISLITSEGTWVAKGEQP